MIVFIILLLHSIRTMPTLLRGALGGGGGGREGLSPPSLGRGGAGRWGSAGGIVMKNLVPPIPGLNISALNMKYSVPPTPEIFGSMY